MRREAAIILAVLFAAASGVYAQEPVPADNASAPGVQREASSFAPVNGTGLRGPTEPKVVGRDPVSFRRPGTLIAQMTHDIQKVDLKELAERKRAMARGERMTAPPRLAYEPGTASSPVAAATAPPAPKDDDVWTAKFGWLGWSLLALILGGAVFAWRRGWFVPFSERERSRSHAWQAASAPARNHAAKARGPRIELVKRGG
jgi:hypothetical protein